MNKNLSLKKIFDFIYSNRYKISIVILLLCIIFKINGSSIGIWNEFIDTNQSNNQNVIVGTSRIMRPDEYAVLTPMFANQVKDGFNYFNDSIRATSTDVFMIYALPVKCIFQIFRPFTIGFMFLGFDGGLSFFWCARFILLFLITLDFLMIITKNNKKLSLIGAIMVTLSPIIQWWFAVNGIAEIFIFGQLSLIMLYKYLNTIDFKKRLLYLSIIFICAGGYALVIYPSWQIPIMYVILVLAIWIIVENKNNCKIKKKDIISIIITIILFITSMAFILYKSQDVIKIVMNTIYPGERFELGGGSFSKFVTYISNIYLPFKSSGLSTNTCESALMFGLFPIGIILSIRSLIINKKKDLLLILLLIVYLFLGTWCIVGFPKWLSKITFMSNSQPGRTILAIGFLDILLLMRSIAITKKVPNILFSIITTLVVSVSLILLNMHYENAYFTNIMTICMFIMCITLFYTILRYNNKLCKYIFALSITFVLIVSGFIVNPIRIGSSGISNSEIIKNIETIDKEEEGIWITEGYEYPINNYILFSGIKAINVTNTYPDLNKWYKIDKDHKYENVYNRYAHIMMILTNDDKTDKFELKNPDYFSVKITIDELKLLNVKYIFTGNNLEIYNNEKTNFDKIYEYNGYKIYKIRYE